MEKAQPIRDESWSAEGVRELRYHIGMSQQALARELGVRQQTVSDWELGLHEPRGAARRMLSMVAERAAEYRAAPPGTPSGMEGDNAEAQPR